MSGSHRGHRGRAITSRTASLRLFGAMEGVKVQRMSLRDELREKRQAILAIAAKHGAREVRLFGSVARGAERSDSDIDLLVEMEPGRSLFDVAALEEELEALLKRRVQIVLEDGLKPWGRERILSEAVPV